MNSSASNQPLREVDFYKTAHNIGIVISPKYRDALAALKQSKAKRILDLGSGTGDFCRFFKQDNVDGEPVAVDISQEAIDVAKAQGLEAICVDIGRQPLPFPDDSFDGVFCGEIIEHVFDPDFLLQEVHRVVKPSTQEKDHPIILTTPNLSSWYNRLFLLFGFQPLFTEVSTQRGFGHPMPFWLNAGHIRVFTYRAIKEFVKHYNFKIQAIKGYGINTEVGYGQKHKGVATVANFLTSPFKSLASDLLIIATKS